MRNKMTKLSDILYANLIAPEPDDEFPFDTADALHMGGCHVLAKALHDVFGYEVLRVNYDRGLHSVYKDDKGYLDASGFADSVQERMVRKLSMAAGHPLILSEKGQKCLGLKEAFRL